MSDVLHALENLMGKRRTLEDTFEIFLRESAVSVLWRGSAKSLEDATSKVKKMQDTAPGAYFIWNPQTGQKFNFDGEVRG